MNPDSILFNVRVYGILLKEDSVLITDEYRYGTFITKFPGGGLQFGEGTIDCLKREFQEEMEMEIEVVKHFYTTDFFQTSAFNNKQQIISIYYLVKANSLFVKKISEKKFDFEKKEGAQSFRFQKIDIALKEAFTYPIDQKVGEMLSGKVYNI